MVWVCNEGKSSTRAMRPWEYIQKPSIFSTIRKWALI